MGALGARAAYRAYDQATLRLGRFDDGGGRRRRAVAKLEAQELRRRELVSPLQRGRHELGRWPAASEREQPTAEHVSRRTYLRRFGSWAAAMEAAEDVQS